MISGSVSFETDSESKSAQLLDCLPSLKVARKCSKVLRSVQRRGRKSISGGKDLQRLSSQLGETLESLNSSLALFKLLRLQNDSNVIA